MDKRGLAIVDVGPLFHISFSLSLSWANPFIFKVLALPRLKCDGISESREPPNKSGLLILWMAKAFVDFHCSVSFLIYPFFPLNQADLEQSRSGWHANVTGRIAASKGVKIVRQRDVLTGVALWRTAKMHPRGRKREEGDGGYWLARFAACPADFHFMGRESQSPLGVYNPPPLPTLPLPIPHHFIGLSGCVAAVRGLQWSIHVGILSQLDCCTTMDIPICYWIPPTYFPLIRILPPCLTCCCPMVSCGDASMRLCPPWH